MDNPVCSTCKLVKKLQDLQGTWPVQMMPWVLTKNARLPASKPWQKQSKKKGTLKNRAREKVRRQQYEAESRDKINTQPD